MASSEEKLIKIIVKTPQLKETIEIKENAKVEELKNLVSAKFNADLERLNLIFAGKILKNNETLSQHKISDGLTIHLVIRPVKKPESEDAKTTSQSTNSTTTTTSTTSTSNTNTNPLGTGNLFNMFGMNDIEGMSRNILGNPEAISSLLDNSIFQSMLTNPDLIRSMVNSNPQMQQLIERNPELNHLLNNEETLRNTINIMRNPAALQELTRSQDRAMSNLESIPGGYNALQRMYTELQEPIMNATMDQFGDNPFANFARQNTNSSSTTNTQSGTENRDPLPNPWSRDSNTTNTSSAPDFPNPFSGSSSFNNLNLQSIMNQFTRNRDTSGNTNVQEEMSNFLNQALQSFQTPEIRNALSNPETIEAMLQISRGYEQLQRVAPELLNSIMLGGANRSCPLTTNTSNITSSTANTTTSNTTTGTNATTTTSSTNSPNVSDLYQLMSQMITDNSSNRGSTQQPSEERYRTQLEQLNSMGFTDRQQNINALAETFGDVNAAIEKLLQTRNYFS